MPNIIEYPNTNIPNPLNCLKICLQGTDEEFVANEGSAAVAQMIIQTPEPIADGTVFTIAGFDFTITTASIPNGFNSNTIEYVANAVLMRDRLIGALLINYNFQDVTITPMSNGIDFIWNNTGIQPNFDFDVSGFLGSSVTFTNGEEFKLNNKHLLYQLFCLNESGNAVPVCEPQNPPPISLNGEIIPNCFSIACEADDVLRTTPPTLNAVPFVDETIKKTFCLRYGTVEYLNTEKEKNLWRYGYENGQGEDATIVSDVQFNNISIPLPNYPYDVTTAFSSDPNHPLSVDLKAWLISQGIDVSFFGVIYDSTLNYFAIRMLACDFDATQLTFSTNATTDSGTWQKKSTDISLICDVKYGDFVKGDPFQVINSKYKNDDLNKFSDYLNAGATGNNFLTDIPSGSTVCCETLRWLWLCIPPGSTNLFVTIKTFGEGGVTIAEDDQGLTLDGGVLVLPVGPYNVNLLYSAFNFADVCSYTIQVKTINGGPPINLSEEYEFRLKKTDCCCDVQIYYKTDAGGFDTICFDKVQSIDFDVEQTEICLGVKCGGLTDGRGMVNGKLKENITLVSKSYQRTRKHRDIFSNFKKSNHRLIKVKDCEGNDILRSFIVEAGGVRIFEAGEKLTVVVTGYYEESEATTEF